MKKQNYLKVIVIGTIICIGLCTTIGVIAATYFPSNCDVTYDNSESGLTSTNVQGAIDELYEAFSSSQITGPAEDILNNETIVTTGDGLYFDEVENKYYYKGSNPNNYITFNNENAGWRIISIEPDGTIKIMKINEIGYIQWNSSSYNKWESASLNTYLNGTYYNSLTATAKKQIVTHTWNIGPINEQIWQGKIALPTVLEFLKSSSNNKCTSSEPNNCTSTIWMNYNNRWWTLTTEMSNTIGVCSVSNVSIACQYIYGAEPAIENAIHPALYLSSEVKITGGVGTKSDPYVVS